MQQANYQPRHYQRNGKTAAAAAAAADTYEEKTKAMNFDSEADSDSESEENEWRRQKFVAALAASEDGRQRSRIVTHPVVRTTMALSNHRLPQPADRTRRPASPSVYSSHLTDSSWWSTQSPVARKTVAASQGGFQLQQQQDPGWRPKSMKFDAELDSSDSDAEWPPEPRYDHDQEDDRQRNRVITRPVVMTTLATASVHHSPVRTRPVSPSPLNRNNLRASQQPQPEESGTTSSQWSTQSAVARKAARSHKNGKKPKKQQKQRTEQPDDSDASRPRSSSESSFGRLFFGWRRRAGYSNQAAAAAAGASSGESPQAQQQQPGQYQYRGKNVHNFSYADAKIYSPQSQCQQQNQQQQQQHQKGTSDSRTKTWWTMETMGAVNSVYSNQVMLAREVPTASAAFPV